MPIEAEVRHGIDQSLLAKGWVLDATSPARNVYLEGEVKKCLPPEAASRLGSKRPDYTLCDGIAPSGVPIAIIEAKKPATRNLRAAMAQARDYAERIGSIELLIVSNGRSVKTEHVATAKPLRIDGEEVSDFLSLEDYRKFIQAGSNEIHTIPAAVVENRADMIRVFEDLNDQLRAAGVRAGDERFSEFANILFLKLLSERNGNGGSLWEQLASLGDASLVEFINKIAVPRLQQTYGGEVIGETQIKDSEILKSIVRRLDRLQLTSLDEDVKGLAFEHFIQRTTGAGNNDLGEYYTPRHIVRFMVKILNPQLGESVYDPFCGTGGFLIEAFKHVSKNCKHTRDNNRILQTEDGVRRRAHFNRQNSQDEHDLVWRWAFRGCAAKQHSGRYHRPARYHLD